MNDVFMLGDVSRIVGVEPYRIVYLLTSMQVPEPPRFGGRRVFSHEHIEAIAGKLGVVLDTESTKEKE